MLSENKNFQNFFFISFLKMGKKKRKEIMKIRTESAICVQNFDDSQNLQFASLIALRCVLHRYGNQDIHRSECIFLMFKRNR